MPAHPVPRRRLAAVAFAAAALSATCTPRVTLPDEGPLRPATLTFSEEPENSLAGTPISPGVAVTVLYNTGDTDYSSTATIRLSIQFGSGNRAGRLHGDTILAAVNGTALFMGVSIDSAGIGYRLLASSNALGSALSDSFDVVHP
jgi:secreted PhoX family phosphatase